MSQLQSQIKSQSNSSGESVANFRKFYNDSSEFSQLRISIIGFIRETQDIEDLLEESIEKNGIFYLKFDSDTFRF